MAHSRQFFGVQVECEDFKGKVGPFSSRESAERWQGEFVQQVDWAESNVFPLYGPVEAEDLMRSTRADRRARELDRSPASKVIPIENIRGDFARDMGHPGGHYG